MKTITHLFTRGVFVTLLVFLAALGTSSGQTYTLSTANCTTTSNSFEFDVMVTNTNASTDLRMNGTVIRGNLPAALIASGTNTIAFSFVNDGQSIIPNSFPPNSVITFSYTPASRLFSTSTLNTVYNNNTCSAPLIAPGATAKIGRFRLLNSTNNFVAGQAATFTWATTASIIAYANCTTTTSTTLVKTLAAPCSVPIPSSCAISASIQSQIDVLCFGGTGFATATSTGGVEPVTYSWNTTPPQSGATASGLLAGGTYVVTATGANACSATASVTITGPASALVASASQDAPILCNGGSTTVTVSATGGTAPYTGTGTFSATAGSNTYTVTDANGCTSSSTVEVTQPSALLLSLTHENALCFGESTGSITAVGTGGTGPYTYSLNSLPAQTSGFFGGLAAGNYFVDVKDANGCVTGSTITVGEPVALTASATSTPTSTPVSTDGTALVSANGGTTPYTITWNTIPVQTGAFASGLAAGSYTATIVDQNGCSTTASVTVSSPSCALLVSATHTDVSCFGGTNGTASASSTGGTGVVTYTIMPGGGSNTTGLFTGLASGVYTITGVDENLCSSSATVTVGSPTELVGSSSATAIACNGGSSTVTVSATGGTAPYTGTGSFSEVAGTYTYTVTDANGCTATTTITITQPSAVVASSSATAIACFGGSSTVTVSATGGTAPYTGTGTFTEAAGTHSYTVTDANGCTATTSVTVTEPAVLLASATSTNASCPTCTDGTVSISSVTGGTAPYTYTDLTDLGSGTYCITVTDANGCTAQACATVGAACQS
ncbi:MAG: SprB repeat-containing protein [Bacteroidetes bacterium]|nr:SprB repeat-containing protein [Bacteroidota bacterium]